MVTAEMVVDVVEDVLTVVTTFIVAHMVTATIWEKISEHQEKITTPLLPSTTRWEEAQHIPFGSHQNEKMSQMKLNNIGLN